MIPRIRRVLAPGLSYGRGIRWDGVEPPPRGPQPRALPHELRTWVQREEGSESESTAGGSRTHTGTVAHDLLRVARMHFATAA